jgi:hypothetical protein
VNNFFFKGSQVKKKTFSRGLIWNRKNFNTEIHVFAPMKFSGSVKIQIQVNTEIIKWLCDVLTFLTDCYKRWLSAHLRSRDPCRIKSYWLPSKKLGVPLVHVSITKNCESQTQVMSPGLADELQAQSNLY